SVLQCGAELALLPRLSGDYVSTAVYIYFLFFFSSRRRHTISVSAFLLNRSSDLRVSGIVMRLRMFLLLITFLKASHSFRNRLLVICKNAYLFATMIMTSVSSPFSCCSGIVRLNLM